MEKKPVKKKSSKTSQAQAKLDKAGNKLMMLSLKGKKCG